MAALARQEFMAQQYSLDYEWVMTEIGELRVTFQELGTTAQELATTTQGHQVTVQALLQVSAQQQYKSEATRQRQTKLNQRQAERDQRFEVLLAEVRYLIRQLGKEE